MLAAAGVSCTSESSDIDEAEFKQLLTTEGASVTKIAETLAKTKACRVSLYRPNALVIGADQILECDGILYDKPNNRDQARTHLCKLQGQTHFLHTSVCAVRNETLLWHYTDVAEMEMRKFSEEFIDSYLTLAGDAVCESVGAYCLEGLGAQLFVRVGGNHFTVLGLPLLPLLRFLRDYGVLAR